PASSTPVDYFISSILMFRKCTSHPSHWKPIGPLVSSVLPSLTGMSFSLTLIVPSALQVTSVVLHWPIGLSAFLCATSSNLPSPLTPMKNSLPWSRYRPCGSMLFGITFGGGWMWTRQPLLLSGDDPSGNRQS